MKKQNNITARLVVYDFRDLEKDKKQFDRFRRWIMGVALEMEKANPKDYLKVFRATLFR